MICSSLKLAALVLASAPRWGEEPDEAVAVWTAPLAIAGNLALSATQQLTPVVYVPLGINFTRSKIEWCVDVAVIHLKAQTQFFEKPPGFSGLWASFGPVVHTGRSPFGGAFFTPKLSIGAFIRTNGELEGDVLIGGEAGYQFTVGSLYLAFVVGFSVGIGVGETDAYAGPWLAYTSVLGHNRDPQGVIGFNLDLLRVGYTF
jgi:hypothetical protein